MTNPFLVGCPPAGGCGVAPGVRCRIELRRRGKPSLWAVIDHADCAQVRAFTWHSLTKPNGVSYALRHTRTPDGRRTTQYLHALLTGKRGIDHIDGDGLNNQRSNLREATNQQNAQNARGSRNSTSAYKGVSRLPGGTWRAAIRLDGKSLHIGCYPTEEDAARAYDAVATQHWGEFARPNFAGATAS